MSDAAIAGLYALVCLIWGSTWVVIKIGLHGVPPFLAAGLRFLLAAATLFGLIAARGGKIRLDRGGRISVFSCGVINFTISYAGVYWAEQYISSGMAAILYCTMPLTVALLSRFWTRTETLSARKMAGILVGMAGTVWLFKPALSVSASSAAGMAVALISSAIASFNLVVVKKYGRETDVFTLNALSMAIGAAGLLGLSLAFEPLSAVVWSRANVFAIVYLALVGSVAAFMSYFTLVKVLEATRLSLITLIFPIVALFLGRVFLNEGFPPSAWTAMGTVLLGVAIAVAPLPAERV